MSDPTPETLAEWERLADALRARPCSNAAIVDASNALPRAVAAIRERDAEIGRLRAALRPFAEINPLGTVIDSELFTIAWIESLRWADANMNLVTAMPRVTAGDLRAAAAAMKEG